MVLAAITIELPQFVAALTAIGGIITILVTSIIRLRNSRSSLNLAEDTHLYKRLRQQQQAQDRRITILENRSQELVNELRKCERHKATCEARLAVIEALHGITPPDIEEEEEEHPDDSGN